jgi:galactoside O-acetyltransferase
VDTTLFDLKKNGLICGSDVVIDPTVQIRYPWVVEIGSRCAIDEYSTFTTGLCLGSFIHISSHCSAIGGASSTFQMDDFSTISTGCRLVCGNDDFKGGFLANPMIPVKFRNPEYTTIRLQRFVILGAGVIVLPGLVVGEGTTVGAGSVVTKNLPPWGVYVGSPARRIAERPKDEVIEMSRRFLAERGRT